MQAGRRWTAGEVAAAAAAWSALALGAAGLVPGCRPEEPPGPPDRERGVRACVVLEGCGYDSLSSFATNLICADSLLGSAYDLRPLMESIRDCVIEAGSAGGDPCPGVAACLNGGAAPPPCAAAGMSCEGDALVGCAQGSRTELDCAAAGATCVMGAAGYAGCGLDSCAPAGFASSCDGTRVLQCDGNGVVAPVDCAANGLVCVMDGAEAYCAGGGEPCDPATFAVSCAGSRATYCVGGAVAEIDCAMIVEDHVCAEVAPGSVDCVPSWDDCIDVADDTCDGTEIVVCVDRRTWRYDCVAFGFTGCVMVDDLPYCY